ncbi:hypothetical protein CAOG_06415 [Capsaspora owczarzaki ATCC 30864]|uniref:BHLH domain-containing protein n=1 Tax=Capsaspora owczarzaki (strain ATCC 30864) TaxID=595528 RepID=A0A0D2ULS1_CAPO3|nr:hypothetical protein CAOG_06415 [Capsaspora owczarzaki ATCC 30864]KJE96041.1 hypothetical protein CAOG_006415 [Capsaspora owczarzaki ATCC 30864]|eukprot:XP_004345164.2 hypothetical protein CAOG_06415 [Capsaspora owczarzaki ATCC 30864]
MNETNEIAVKQSLAHAQVPVPPPPPPSHPTVQLDESLARVFSHLSLEYDATVDAVVPRWKKFSRSNSYRGQTLAASTASSSGAGTADDGRQNDLPSSSSALYGGVTGESEPRYTSNEAAQAKTAVYLEHIEKKRLDNAIWRAWHLWRVHGITTPYVNFNVDRAALAQAAAAKHKNDVQVLRGQLARIAREYHSWRAFYKSDVYRQIQRRSEEPTAPSTSLMPEVPAEPPAPIDMSTEPFSMSTTMDVEPSSGFALLESLASADEENLLKDLVENDIFADEMLGEALNGLSDTLFSSLGPFAIMDAARANAPARGMGNVHASQPRLEQLFHREQTLPSFAPASWVANDRAGAPQLRIALQPTLSSGPSVPPVTASYQSSSAPNSRRNSTTDVALSKLAHVAHEQKRRDTLRSGFDELTSLIQLPVAGHTSFSLKPNQKLCKATVLSKTVEFIESVHRQNAAALAEANRLRQEIYALKMSISQQQAALLQSGANQAMLPTRPPDPTNIMYREYVQATSTQNLKFWIFSSIADKLFATYSPIVRADTPDAVSDTMAMWLSNHCQIEQLREATLSAVRAIGSALFPGTSSSVSTALPIMPKPR